MWGRGGKVANFEFREGKTVQNTTTMLVRELQAFFFKNYCTYCLQSAHLDMFKFRCTSTLLHLLRLLSVGRHLILKHFTVSIMPTFWINIYRK